MMRPQRRITAEQFRLLRLQDTRIDPKNHWALFEIFVNGRSQRALAGELGMTRSAMSQLVRKVWQRFLELPDNDTRLTTVTITILAKYESALHAWVRDAHQRLPPHDPLPTA
ncbi:TrfB-related DNA-binding protein [Burkholderia contaminans]|uniref:TrfB-related DNA-binding protein n=1 Tax=Burkholderia contaminans TaxID=488447 RepID=UPI0024175B2D|nr:TrfB-related DNA-binding protein [Burkholderia contaminans]WFN11645.1 transcriptional regulator KorA [Burkholderia contaminans]